MSDNDYSGEVVDVEVARYGLRTFRFIPASDLERMSDLFHDQVPDDYIARVFAVMAEAPRHTFQVLTKRHARMRSLLSSPGWTQLLQYERDNLHSAWDDRWDDSAFPPEFVSVLPNVWLGVSTENQQWADIRIPALLDTPAAVRFISAEPLLGPIDLRQSLKLWTPPAEHIGWRSVIPPFTPGLGDVGDGPMVTAKLSARDVLHWVIVGGESGRDARPMHPDWARSLRDQCVDAGIAFHFKQFGEWRMTVDIPPEQVREDVAEDLCDQDYFLRLGKRRAGRELDGRTWDQYPEEVTA